jgi:hypothetical protein
MHALLLSAVLAVSVCYDHDIADCEYALAEINHFGKGHDPNTQLILWEFLGGDGLHAEDWTMNGKWVILSTRKHTIIDWRGDGQYLLRVNHLYERRTFNDPEIDDRKLFAESLRRTVKKAAVIRR